MIGLVAAATFAVLDLYAPAVALGARQGSGFGIGQSLVGGAESLSKTKGVRQEDL